MATELFVTLSLTVLLALVISSLMRVLKQPLIIGYIFTGIITGPYFLNFFRTDEFFGTLSQIGVALLLFVVGLHLNPRVIKEVGKVSLITGVGQVLFTSVVGFLVSLSLGFSFLVSMYIAIALTFSSTIIIMKLLSDKGDLESVYGKISVGFLIVQDLIAVFALMAVSSLSTGNEGFGILIFNTFVKGGAALLILSLFSFFVLPHFVSRAAKSQELLFLFSVGWCLAIASLFFLLDFSIEIGALIAGVALSISPYSTEISSKMKPLRDFFIILFFIIIGSQIVFADVQQNWFSILVFSLIILLGNPLIVMILMGVLGYTKRNSFMAGLTVAQIGEFSILFISLGVGVGHISTEILSLVTTIGLITITGSTYLVIYSNQIYDKIKGSLSIFEKKKSKQGEIKIKDYDAILFGYNRIGFNILRSLKKVKKSYLVVDFNPDTIRDLSLLGIPCLYGDVYDSDFLESLSMENTKIVVSTIPEFETNKLLIDRVRRSNPDAIILVRAHQIKDALELYKVGATYVLTPHFLGGEYLSKMIRDFKTKTEGYKSEKKKHLDMLFGMLNKGHEHPDIEKN